MPFDKTPIKAPVRVSRLTLLLASVRAADGTITYSSRFDMDVVDAEGDLVRSHNGDLSPHLTDPQKAQLKTFIDGLRVKAETETLAP